MKYFLMMCGLSGSGKSYTAKRIAEELHLRSRLKAVTIISSDEVRKELYGTEEDQEHNTEVFKTIHNRIENWAKQKVDDILIFDATNLTFKNRRSILALLNSKPNIYKGICVVATPFEQCVENDLLRERHVGRDVIYKQMCRFEAPQKYEGWDGVEIRNSSETDFTSLTHALSKMDNVDQNNPHHKLTLLEHCVTAYEEARKNGEQIHLQVALLLHDIGKLYTLSTDNNGISHYYNHANASVYYVLANSKILEKLKEYVDLELILFYIQNHMRISDIDKNCKDKYMKLWGEFRYNQLLKMKEYDTFASGLTEKEHEEIKKEQYGNDKNFNIRS